MIVEVLIPLMIVTSAGVPVAETSSEVVYSDLYGGVEQMPVSSSLYVDFSLSTPSAGVPKKLVEKAVAPLVDTIEADFIAHQESILLNWTEKFLDLRLSVNGKGFITGVDILRSEVDNDIEQIALGILEGSSLSGLPTQAFTVEISLLFACRDY